MKWTILFAVLLLSSWVLPGCTQAPQSAGGIATPATPAGDTAVAEAPPPAGDETADTFLPIDPKMDPRSIDGGETGAFGGDIDIAGDGERLPITGEMLGGLEPLGAPADARLRYGTDSKILAKSPAASYGIRAQSATIAPSFSVEQNWDPALADQSWIPLTDSFASKPQLRAVYVPPGLHQHILYSDADWAANTDGGVIYSFSNLSVVEGGELRFFMKETKTADFHSGGLVALDSDDAANPFPSETTATIYPVGSFQMKAVILSPAPGPAIHPSDDPSLPLKD